MALHIVESRAVFSRHRHCHLHRLLLLCALLVVVARGEMFRLTTSRSEDKRTSDHDEDAETSSAATMTFEVLQYNLFGRPYQVSKDGQSERLNRVPASLVRISPNIDVVSFAEADIASDRGSMLAQFREQGFAHATSILHDPDPFTSVLNGGVLIVSKWPVMREAQHVYRNACHYSDCLAAKGVKYARLLKTVNGTSKIFNVFATHMQAWSTTEGRSDRVKQAQQMRNFVDAMQIPHHEPLIFAGDFNVDNHTYGTEVAHLVELLGAHEPLRIGAQLFTSDPHTNVLVGRDGAAISNKCSAQYVQSWGPDKVCFSILADSGPVHLLDPAQTSRTFGVCDCQNNVYHPSALTRTACGAHLDDSEPFGHVFLEPGNMCYCPCCPLEWLDYVLYGKAPYQQPSSVPTLEAHVNQVQHFTVDWTAAKSNMKMALIDLSDHYPVLGKLEFSVNNGPGKDNDPATYHLDGCSTDDDCHFRNFRCYCKGANCYFKGNHTSGWDLDSEHPVNRNCLYQKTSFLCLCGPT